MNSEITVICTEKCLLIRQCVCQVVLFDQLFAVPAVWVIPCNIDRGHFSGLSVERVSPITYSTWCGLVASFSRLTLSVDFGRQDELEGHVL